jgi:hypothetical protein
MLKAIRCHRKRFQAVDEILLLTRDQKPARPTLASACLPVTNENLMEMRKGTGLAISLGRPGVLEPHPAPAGR